MSAEPIIPDTEHGLVALLPPAARPYALLARFDRPIGAWLLFWPGAWAILLARGADRRALLLLALFAIGAVAMRGAGCVYNDIVDRELDRGVARTAARPLASGRVTLAAAWGWLALLCLIGLAVLVTLPRVAILVALASVLPVACYPYMKRITWWPQAWLGIVFGWGALAGGAAATGRIEPACLWLYTGSIAWVIGYDTIYALQDIEDDALAGVKSSARAMGRHVRVGVALCYGVAVPCWAVALGWQMPTGGLAVVPAAVHLGWQVARLDPASASGALARFRSNRTTGLLMALATLAVGIVAP